MTTSKENAQYTNEKGGEQKLDSGEKELKKGDQHNLLHSIQLSDISVTSPIKSPSKEPKQKEKKKGL